MGGGGGGGEGSGEEPVEDGERVEGMGRIFIAAQHSGWQRDCPYLQVQAPVSNYSDPTSEAALYTLLLVPSWLMRRERCSMPLRLSR